MTIAQMEEARILIDKRKDIEVQVQKLADAYKVYFYSRLGSPFYSPTLESDETKELHEEVLQATKNTAISVLIKKRDEITAELKALGVEE